MLIRSLLISLPLLLIACSSESDPDPSPDAAPTGDSTDGNDATTDTADGDDTTGDDGDDAVATGGDDAPDADGPTGLVTGRTILSGKAVKVAAFDGLVVGAPLGASTIGEDGTFEVEITPTSMDGRIVVTVGDDLLRTTIVLEDGSGDAAVTLLTTLWVDLAGVYRIDGQSPDGALLIARQNLNEHFERPDTIDTVGALPDVEPPGLYAALFADGLAHIADEGGADPAALFAVLRDDLGDGVFDGLAAGEAIQTPAGFVPTVETTRYDLAAAMYAVADDPDAIGELLWNVSTDDGALYPDEPPPTGFEPNAATVAFVAPTPEDGSWHNAPFDVVIEVENATVSSINVDGVDIPGTSATLDPETLGEGSHTIAGRAVSALGTLVEVVRTIQVDLTGPEITFTAPPAGELLLVSAFDVSGTVVDTGVGPDELRLYVDETLFWSTALPDGPEWTVPYAASEPVTITAVAHDLLGNQSEAELDVLVDAEGPEITLDAPLDGLLTANASVTFSGLALDAVHTATLVTVTGGEGEWVTQVDEAGAWALDASLFEGTHDYAVVATDSVGHEGPAVTVTLTLDTVPPSLDVLAPTGWYAPGPITASGTATDPAGVASVIAGGVEAQLEGEAWTAALGDYLDGGDYIVEVTATDALGNTSAPVVQPFSIDAMPPVIHLSPVGASAVGVLDGEPVIFMKDPVSDWTCEPKDAEQPGTETVCFNGVCADDKVTITVDATEPTMVECTGTDGVGNEDIGSLKVAWDDNPPAITIVTPTADLHTDQTTLTVSGTVADEVEVEKLWVKPPGTAKFEVDIVDGAWSAEVDGLEAGDNTITVSAIDELENLGSTTVDVYVDHFGPTIEFLNTTTIDEATMTITWDGTDPPVLTGGSTLPLGPACDGACVVRKLLHRFDYFAEEDENVPTPIVSMTDDTTPASEILLHTRYFGSDGEPMAVVFQTTYDGTWDDPVDGKALAPMTWGALGIGKGNEWKFKGTLPETLVVTAYDEFGNESSIEMTFQVQLLAPPLFFTEATEYAPDGTDIANFTLDGGNLDDLFNEGDGVNLQGGARLGRYRVDNPWPVNLDVEAVGGGLRMTGFATRPYLADNDQVGCQQTQGCTASTCVHEWPDGPSAADGCTAQTNFSTTGVVSEDVGALMPTPVSSSGAAIALVDQTFWPIGQESFVWLDLRAGVHQQLCALGGPHDIDYTSPATAFPPLPPLEKTATVFTWNDDGVCAPGSLDGGHSRCAFEGPCGAVDTGVTYQRPPLLTSLTVQSDAGPLLDVTVRHNAPGPEHVQKVNAAVSYTTTSGVVSGLPTAPYLPY